MAKDPAFLFYPGDYLRDTQCLTEAVQVAYDRIMCEHMRNICISEAQLNFFTKKLTEAEKEELKMVLTKTESGYCITWVAESIVKRRGYSESRRKNRSSKSSNISKTYVKHMENENENENEDINTKGGMGGKDSLGHFEKVKMEISNSVSWLEMICMKFKIDINSLHGWLDDFFLEVSIKGKTNQTQKELQEYFFNWLNLKIKEQKTDATKQFTDSREARKRGTDELANIALQVLASKNQHGG